MGRCFVNDFPKEGLESRDFGLQHTHLRLLDLSDQGLSQLWLFIDDQVNLLWTLPILSKYIKRGVHRTELLEYLVPTCTRLLLEVSWLDHAVYFQIFCAFGASFFGALTALLRFVR